MLADSHHELHESIVVGRSLAGSFGSRGDVEGSDPDEIDGGVEGRTFRLECPVDPIELTDRQENVAGVFDLCEPLRGRSVEKADECSMAGVGGEANDLVEIHDIVLHMDDFVADHFFLECHDGSLLELVGRSTDQLEYDFTKLVKTQDNRNRLAARLSVDRPGLLREAGGVDGEGRAGHERGQVA
ncbi:MAG: hypothetical protein ABI862_21455, partial [Ilumatobacteraceae bacterium]